MKIFYITNARIPTEKAHGIATVKLCEAFTNAGASVTLFVPWRVNALREDPYAYYGIRKNFEIVRIPSIDLLWLGFGKRFFFFLQVFSFSVTAALWIWTRYGYRDTVVFSHDHIPLFFASFFTRKIFYDVHDLPVHTFLYDRVMRRAFGFSVQTRRKIEKLKEDFGVPETKVVYWPNGVDIKRFDIPLSQKEAREKLNLPQDKKIVLYTGQLFAGRGVETLIEAAGALPNSAAVYIVGGSQSDIEKFRIQNSEFRIRFVGQRPWLEMPLWMKAADVAVVPHSTKVHASGVEDVSRYYISPMKLFEYMASRVPIVASDIPAIREIVDESMVFFAQPDDPQSFAAVISYVLAHTDEAVLKSTRARQEVEKYTWDARAEKILEKIYAIQRYT